MAARTRRRPFASLTARLVVTTVALVALVSLLIATATTLAMRAYLNDRLDDLVEQRLAQRLRSGPGPDAGAQRYSGVGSLYAGFVEDYGGRGEVVLPGDDGAPYAHDLTEADLAALAGVPDDGEAREVSLPEQGNYRVAAVRVGLPDRGPNTAVLVVGLPSNPVGDTITSLIGWEALLTLLGVGAAAGAGFFVVRRQLRPLREVAATAERVSVLPLATGEIQLSDRVPAHLVDEATEVGQVGASLNTLLAHVESSLEARHRSEQQVRQFVADASHELRTPLTTIKGYAELARRRPDDAAAVLAALEKVEAESGRMTTLVEDLLLLARIDAGRPLAQQPVDLTRMLIETVSDARVLAPEQRWRLDLPETAVQTIGDEQRLHQLVTNLLTNAGKHTPAGTTVTVTARPGALTVHDDGPGFPAALVPTAFERFVRADSARTRSGDNGAGLGLALVQAIAAAHGGSVSLSSVPGDTTVTLHFPEGHPTGQTDPPTA